MSTSTLRAMGDLAAMDPLESARRLAARRLAKILQAGGVYDNNTEPPDLHAHLMQLSEECLRQRAELASSRSTSRTNSGSTAEFDLLRSGNSSNASSNASSASDVFPRSGGGGASASASASASGGSGNSAEDMARRSRGKVDSFASVGSDDDFVAIAVEEHSSDDEDNRPGDGGVGARFGIGAAVGSAGPSRLRQVSVGSLELSLSFDGDNFPTGPARFTAGTHSSLLAPSSSATMVVGGGGGDGSAAKRHAGSGGSGGDAGARADNAAGPAGSAGGRASGEVGPDRDAGNDDGARNTATTAASGSGGGEGSGGRSGGSGNDNNSGGPSADAGAAGGGSGVGAAFTLQRTPSGTAMPSVVHVGQLDLSGPLDHRTAAAHTPTAVQSQDLNRRNYDHPAGTTVCGIGGEAGAGADGGTAGAVVAGLRLGGSGKGSGGLGLGLGLGGVAGDADDAAGGGGAGERKPLMGSTGGTDRYDGARHHQQRRPGRTQGRLFRTPEPASVERWMSPSGGSRRRRALGSSSSSSSPLPAWGSPSASMASSGVTTAPSSSSTASATTATNAGGAAATTATAGANARGTLRGAPLETLVGVWRRRPSPSSRTDQFVKAMRFPKPIARLFRYMKDQMFRFRWVAGKSTGKLAGASSAGGSAGGGGGVAAGNGRPSPQQQDHHHHQQQEQQQQQQPPPPTPTRAKKKQQKTKGFVEFCFMHSGTTPLSLGFHWVADSAEHPFEPRVIKHRPGSPGSSGGGGGGSGAGHPLGAGGGRVSPGGGGGGASHVDGCTSALARLLASSPFSASPSLSPSPLPTRATPSANASASGGPPPPTTTSTAAATTTPVLGHDGDSPLPTPATVLQDTQLQQCSRRWRRAGGGTVTPPPRKLANGARGRGKRGGSGGAGGRRVAPSPYRKLGPGPLNRIVEHMCFSAAGTHVRYHCCKTNSGMKKLLLRVFCNGDGLDVLQRKLEFKFWPWNDILLCRVTLEEQHYGREGNSFWVKRGTSQETYDPCF